MKYLFTLLLAFSLCNEPQAQELTAGLRTGASYWWQNKNSETFHFESADGQKYTWDQEVFVRFKSKKHWAYEVGFIHNNQNQNLYVNDLIYYDSHKNYYTLNVSLQYDMTCHYFQKCPLLKHFKSFIGIDIDPVLVHTNSLEGPGYSFTASYIPSAYDNYDFYIWAGLSNTLTYSLGKHWQLSSVVCFKLYPENYFGGGADGPTFYGTYPPCANLSLRIGAAYRLN